MENPLYSQNMAVYQTRWKYEGPLVWAVDHDRHYSQNHFSLLKYLKIDKSVKD